MNGVNSQMVTKITGKTIREEATEATRTCDLLTSIRATRMKWLGQILRMGEDRLVKKAVKTLYKNRKFGDTLMDAPTAPWRELCNMASDEKGWQQRVRAIKDKVYLKTTSKNSEKGGIKKRKKRREGERKRRG